MSEHLVKIAFWLRAFDSVTVEAHSDADAIDKAKAAARIAMESGAHPEHIDIEERREGIIAFIDRVGPNGRRAVSRTWPSTTTVSTTRPPADRRP